MENKINIAELLKDCPEGMELYSPIYGIVYFKGVRDTGREVLIDVKTSCNTEIQFYPDGKFNTYYSDSEMTLFPSKDVRTWEGFVPPCKFKDGDILATDLGTIFYLNTHLNTDKFYGCYVAINCYGSFYVSESAAYKEFCRLATEEEKTKLFQAIKKNGYRWNNESKILEKLKFKNGDILANGDTIFIYNGVEDNLGYGTYVIIDIYGAFAINIPTKKYGTRLTTEEEKEKLFKAIKDNGYKWNDETKTLEKLIEPKFKVGDIVQDKDGYKVRITEIRIEDKCYGYNSLITNGIGCIPFNKQNEWELLPNKFDINTLKPFDKVLVRNTNKEYWMICMFGYILNDDKQYFICTAKNVFYQCIPYEGNEHLLGITNDCDEFYKTWEK